MGKVFANEGYTIWDEWQELAADIGDWGVDSSKDVWDENLTRENSVELRLDNVLRIFLCEWRTEEDNFKQVEEL